MPANTAVAETLDCYPDAGLDKIKAILDYRAAHEFQAQS
jgi:DNA uptake protein ComE-like DNA-binding protein